MKKIIKIIMIVIVLFMFSGCENKVNKEKEVYLKYIKIIKENKEYTKKYPFDIEVSFDKITDDEVRYQIVIDNPKEDIYDLEAIAIHNKQTNDIFPSIGIFDEKEDLLVGKKPSGVILVGYIDYVDSVNTFKCSIKVLVKYKTKDGKSHKVHYMTKK